MVQNPPTAAWSMASPRSCASQPANVFTQKKPPTLYQMTQRAKTRQKIISVRHLWQRHLERPLRYLKEPSTSSGWLPVITTSMLAGPRKEWRGFSRRQIATYEVSLALICPVNKAWCKEHIVSSPCNRTMSLNLSVVNEMLKQGTTASLKMSCLQQFREQFKNADRRGGSSKVISP